MISGMKLSRLISINIHAKSQFDLVRTKQVLEIIVIRTKEEEGVSKNIRARRS